MVRTPCCENMGMKKGPWTPEEDQILVSYIQHYGHENWRALPKQAGLLRCGKSCRLRWINYLRPDIKRGNFTKEEEETIIKLHQLLGNRWAAIAAKLPGRTDNEIKNFWHTHLKKKLLRRSSSSTAIDLSINSTTTNYHKHFSNHNNIGLLSKYNNPMMINMSSNTTVPVHESMATSHAKEDHHQPPVITSTAKEDATWNNDDYENNSSISKKIDEEMEFWYNLFVKSSGEPSRVLVNNGDRS